MILGIEFGSTRIKAVLINEDFSYVCSGGHDWENSYKNGYWTYDLEDVWTGLRSAFSDLIENYNNVTGNSFPEITALGLSGMMHGYLAFDKEGNLLTPFRTWRNTTSKEASDILFKELSFNIPQRWSACHLYQAILNKESHTNELDYITSLAGYVHRKVTGERVIGIGEASGMFPINSDTLNYDMSRVKKFEALCKKEGFDKKFTDIFPRVLCAGENAGYLTEEGAALIDPSGRLKAGIPLAPPEGDAGTGMVATCSVKEKTGNISCGTSIFLMMVLEHELNSAYPEIDMITTPDGKPVAMVHCNNGTSEVKAWVDMFFGLTKLLNLDIDEGKLYNDLFNSALSAEPDAGGVVSCNYLSGEHLAGLTKARPVVTRRADSDFTIENLMLSQLYTTFATLRLGYDILSEKENVCADRIFGHGGLFKTKLVGQKILASALNASISVMDTASEGGAWGMALLAAYMNNNTVPLSDFLEQEIFSAQKISTETPDERLSNGFNQYMESFKEFLKKEQAIFND